MYADPVDRAQEYEALETQERIRLAAKPLPKRLPQDPGYCDECGDPTPSQEHLFCGIECSRADEKRQRQLRLQGG